MATPKMNMIINSFTERIGDPATYITGVLQGGKILTNPNTIVEFVNRAMFEHIRKYWTAVNGDNKLFSELFPELISPPKTVTLSAVIPTYVLANPNLDFMKMFGAIYRGGNNVYIRIAPKDQYVDLKSGVNSRLIATEGQPVLVELNKTLYLFPSTLAGKQIDIIYIQQPLNPTDGSFLTQNGAYDSPFYDTWNDEIAGIAEVFFRRSAQQQ